MEEFQFTVPNVKQTLMTLVMEVEPLLILEFQLQIQTMVLAVH